jgi:hypothetical protein
MSETTKYKFNQLDRYLERVNKATTDTDLKYLQEQISLFIGSYTDTEIGSDNVRSYAAEIKGDIKTKLKNLDDENRNGIADKANPEPTKEHQVRAILQPLFNDCGEHQFNSLIEHITAKKRPIYTPAIKFSGIKIQLYSKLMAVVELGYDRKHLASVFSELCAMNYDQLYKKISN